MANTLNRTRIHFLVGIAGITVSCFGFLILASGIMIDGNSKDLSKESSTPGSTFGTVNITCQYWAGIPTILTGAVLVYTVSVKPFPRLKYVSMCCTLVIMVVALGVIIEESGNHSNVRTEISTTCKDRDNPRHDTRHCASLKRANAWYYTLLFTTAVLLASCVFVLLVLIADWILFVALKALQNEQVETQPPPYTYEDANAGTRAPAVEDQQMSNVQYQPNQGAVPLLRV